VPNRRNKKYKAYLASVGRPVVTSEERKRARRFRATGHSLRVIAAKMGRVKSTIFHMLRSKR